MTRPWIVHVVLVVTVLLGGLVFVANKVTTERGFAVAFGFLYLPFAVAFAVASTVLALAFAALAPSRPTLAIALAHPVALILGALGLFLLARPG
jgi:hypothetical protein